jgi:L-alanine-DL-glutamate epimerase-like enolase superfamily enzyme
MKLNYKTIELELEFTFAISRGSRNTSRTIILELEYLHKGRLVKALGESVFSRFYGEDEKSVSDFYQKIITQKLLEDLDPFNIQEFESRIAALPGNNQAAKAGLDIALWDLRTKLVELPLYKYLGLDPKLAPKTSYTIGIADLDTMKSKTQIAIERGYDILKIKLGTENDIKIMETIRKTAPQARIRVDANAAWTLKQALATLNEIKNFDIEFVEEPLRLDSSASDYIKLFENSPLELMADESCHTLHDIPKCARFFHSINLKHTKTGGLTEAIRMINSARAHNLKIMLGCFTETSISITAFAHLSPLVDFADLDGSLLLKHDPFQGVIFEHNQIKLPERAGLGIINTNEI